MPKERSSNSHIPSIVKLPERITMRFMIHRFCRAVGYPATRMSSERTEPCEGKLSRTVLGCVGGLTARTYPVQHYAPPL